MNIHAAKPDPVSHDSVQLLPWLADCAMDEAEFAAVQAHLEVCPECQADLALQARLRAAIPPDDNAFDADRAFARLLPRLGPQAPQATNRPVLDRWRRAAAANAPWLRWTVAAQLAVIGIMAAMLARPGAGPGDYHALGSARAAQGDLVLVFRPDTTEQEMRRILQASGARVVDGPGVTGAWVLALSPGQPAGALSRLRAEPAVALVQPLAAGSQP